MNHRLLLEIALHEAGHAVIARVVGLKSGEAVITDRDGYAHWKADNSIRHVITLLAGRAASDVILGRTTESGYAGDNEKIMRLLEADGFRERFFAFDVSRDALLAHARALIRKHRDAVERVARALLERETLTARKIDKLMTA